MTIEENATLDVQQVLQGLRAMTTGLTNVTTAMSKLNDVGEKTKRTMKENFKDGAGVASRAGGPAGSFTSKLLGGGAMDGVFGKLAVAVSLGALAFRAFQSAVDASLDRVRLMIEAQRSMRQVAEQAGKALENQAQRGEGQMKGRLQVAAAGGKEATDLADQVTGSGYVSVDQANQGVARIFGRFGNTDRARNATQLATTASGAGLDFAEVAEQLTKMGASVDNSDQTERMIGRMLQKKTGRVGDPADIYRESMANVYNDPYVQKWAGNNRTRAGIAGYERESFLGSGSANKDLAEANSPMTALQVEANAKFDQMIVELKAAAAAQGNISGLMADLFGSGSFETQMRRALNARAAAEGLPVGTTTPAEKAANLTKKTYGLFGATFSER